jgi:CBS-domain-containing membrane protein
MQLTKTIHPPGGATALIAALQPVAISLHFSFLLLVLLWGVTFCAWALVVGNLGRRRYPLLYVLVITVRVCD